MFSCIMHNIILVSGAVDIQWNLTIKPPSGLGQSDQNNKVTVLAGLHFMVMEIIWDAPFS